VGLQVMPRRFAVVEVSWRVQVAPPSVVPTIQPLPPTAVQAAWPVQETPQNQLVVDADWDVHVIPLLVVARIVLLPPTA